MVYILVEHRRTAIARLAPFSDLIHLYRVVIVFVAIPSLFSCSTIDRPEVEAFAFLHWISPYFP